jgi:DNA-binding transcriptional MerR regulator
MADSFSAIEAARIAGLPYRTLDYWATTGFIVPSITEASGRGSERRYAFDDLVALRVARQLRDAGVSVQALRVVAENLQTREDFRNPLAESRLIVVGSDVLLVTDPNQILSMLRKPGQAAFAFVFDLSRTVEEIRRDVESRETKKPMLRATLRTGSVRGTRRLG